jgi:acetyl esterase/lipase
MTSPLRISAAFACLLTLAPLAGCSGISVYNDLAAQGDTGEVVLQDIAYGPNKRQSADIYIPAGNPQGAPVVVFFYGGKWSSGTKADYSFVGETFAQRGYVTIVADYRLVPQIKYPAFVEDTAKATAFAYTTAARYGGDPNKLFLVGHSAGAYNAVMVALAPEFLAQEGLTPAVIKGVAAISGPYDFVPFDADMVVAAFGGTPNLPATQPINRVAPDQFVPPMLLLAGTSDTLVRPRHTERFAAVLAANGKHVETIYYKGVGHAATVLSIGEPMRKRAPVVDDVLNFLARQQTVVAAPPPS